MRGSRSFLSFSFLTLALVCGATRVDAQDVASARRELTAADDFRLRLGAALYLGKSNDQNARADLERALADAHPAVRSAAAAGLAAHGDPAAVTALTARMAREASPSVKSQIRSSIDQLRSSGGVAWPKTKYLVQLGSMRNASGVRGDALGAVLRSAAATRARGLPGAVVVDGDEGLMRQAAARRVPVIALDGAVTRLENTQQNGRTLWNAQVEFTVRRIPQQTLKGTLSGGATSVGTGHAFTLPVVAELQNQAVDGAVASALRGADASFARAMH